MTPHTSRSGLSLVFAVAAVFVPLAFVVAVLPGCFRAVERPAPRIEMPSGPGVVTQDGRNFHTTVSVDDPLDFEVVATRRSDLEDNVSLSIDLASTSPVEDPVAFGFTGTPVPQEDSGADEASVSLTGTAEQPGTIVFHLVASDGWATVTARFTIVVVGAPTQLVFVQQPTNTAAGNVIEPHVRLELRDAEDSVVDSSADVELALGSDPGSAQLGGTLTVSAVAGVATFDDLTLDRVAAGYTFTATSGTLTVTSDAFDVLPRVDQLLPDILYTDFSVRIFGFGFDATPANNVVTFDGTPGNVTDASEVELAVEVPSLTSSGLLQVTVNGVDSAEVVYLLSPFSPSAGAAAEAHSFSISDDGRYLVFVTDSALLPADTNGTSDVYMIDRGEGGLLHLVSRTSNGDAGNGASFDPVISGDGTAIVFASDANNLVADDNNSATDIFRYEVATGEVTLLSQTTVGQLGNGPSTSPSVSEDGLRVAFISEASNLGSTTIADVILRDLRGETPETLAITDGDNASRHPAISPDGEYVAFASQATNLHPQKLLANFAVFLYDIDADTFEVVSRDSAGNVADVGDSAHPTVSNAGSHVAFETESVLVPEDTNGESDVYLRHVSGASTTLISLAESGTAAGDQGSFRPSISADGRFVAFASDATNLMPDVTNNARDIYLVDLDQPSIRRLSLSAGNVQGNDDSDIPYLSRNGRYCAFESLATSLIPGTSPGRNAFVVGLSY